VLVESIDVVARGILGNRAIIINCEDIFLLGDHVVEATTGAILEGDTGGLGAEDPVDIVYVIELVIEALGHFGGLRWISILHNDEVIRLKEWPPHLEKIQVPDRGYHHIQLVLQDWGSRTCHFCFLDGWRLIWINLGKYQKKGTERK
jgi:hypothetical protein